MIGLVGIHVGLSGALALGASLARGRGLTLRGSALEFFTALLLPGVGALGVLIQIVMEALFRWTVEPAGAAELFEANVEDPARRARVNPLEEIRAGIMAAPFGETLDGGEPLQLDLAMRRLAGAATPAALLRLREALESPSRDVRVRARGLLVRVEEKLLTLLRSSADPAERGRAHVKLAALSPDGRTARRHLEQAAAAFREAPARGPADPSVGLELGQVLLGLGDAAGAREAFNRHLHRHPRDPRGYVGRAQASFRLGDRSSLRLDFAYLALLDASYEPLARRWADA